MKRILVLVAIAALIVSVIPFADSSDATGETTISGYFKGGDVSSSSSIFIGIIYSEDGNNGTLIGVSETISPPDNTGKNRFTVTIEPGTHHEMNYYYIYINILGYKITRLADDEYENNKCNLNVTDPRTSQTSVYNNCYGLVNGEITVGTDNFLGSEKRCFEVESTKGTITGKVVKNTKEPVYLTGVKVSLLNKDTKEVLATYEKTDENGYYFNYYTGTYELLFEMSGYDSVTNEVVITADTETKLPNIIMKENQSYFGFDLSHAMMILGGTAAVILLLFTIVVRVKLSKR